MGEGEIRRLSHIAYAGNTLIITSPFFTQRGITKIVADQFSEREITIFDRVEPNPGIDDLDDLTNKLRKKNSRQLLLWAVVV